MAPVDGDNVSICDDMSSMSRLTNWSWNFAISDAASLWREENKNAGKKLAKFIWMRIFLDFYDFELTLPIRPLEPIDGSIQCGIDLWPKNGSDRKSQFNGKNGWNFLNFSAHNVNRFVVAFQNRKKAKIRETFRFSIQNADKKAWNFTIQRKVFAERGTTLEDEASASEAAAKMTTQTHKMELEFRSQRKSNYNEVKWHR